MSNPPPRPAPKPRSIKIMKAIYDYRGQEADELSFSEGDILYILDSSHPDWWRARCKNQEGMVPSNLLEDATSNGTTSPLHDAAKRGNVDVVADCLANRMPVNQADQAGNTPLHWAARGGHLDCVEKLLEVHQIMLDVENRLGETALMLGSAHGHAHVVERLLRQGANSQLTNRDGKNAGQLTTDPEVAAIFNRFTGGGMKRTGYSCEDYGHNDDASEDED